MVIAFPYAVLVGVGLSIVLYVVRQPNELTIKRWTFDEHGDIVENDPPERLPCDESVILQPYESLLLLLPCSRHSCQRWRPTRITRS
jgi:sulfate permease, SulP family